MIQKFNKISYRFADSLSVSFKFSLSKWDRLLCNHEEND